LSRNSENLEKPNFLIRHKEFLIFFIISIICVQILSFISYNPYDISFYTTSPNDPKYNFAGLIGAYLSFSFLFTFGFGALISPLFFTSLIYKLFKEHDTWDILKWFFYLQISMISISMLLSLQAPEFILKYTEMYQLTGPGGITGSIFTQELIIPFLGIPGGTIIFTVLFLISLQGIISFSYFNISKIFLSIIKISFLYLKKTILLLISFLFYLFEKIIPAKNPEGKSLKIKPVKKTNEATETEDKKFFKKSIKADKATKAIFNLPRSKTEGWTFPSLDLLEKPDTSNLELEENIEANASMLTQTLEEFDVECKVVGIEKGPVITRYEIQIASGTKVAKVTSLENDISLAMKAKSVRIIAPIPGKSAIGIEIPNQIRKMVSFRELLTSKDFKHMKSAIPLILGKDISGQAIIADLTTMPHLLIAGATGAGKSVCINTIIMSILYTLSPSEVKILLVDPKKVELSMYKNLPHLFVPLITNPNKVSMALKCLMEEMDRRYQLFKETGVRNISGYNEKDKTEYRNKLISKELDIDPLEVAPDILPFIVVIIDELADLMMVARAEIENSIVRIAQLARACGIHMILATQRPSVNVVTGLIKANIPARIAFRVTSPIDSRTILDSKGADKLLGKGDMLFVDPGEIDYHRIQGAYLEDAEISRVVQYWEEQGTPQFDRAAMTMIARPIEQIANVDPLFDEAIEAIKSHKQASTTFLQKRFRIGYNRASRLIDNLESQGLIGPALSGGKTREIYIDDDN